MNRSKSLLFRTWELFRIWYSTMKQRFTQLTLRYLKFSPGNPAVQVVISY